MNNHKVVVTGKFEPQKVVKKLRKKTGKKVEILVKEKENIKSDTKLEYLEEEQEKEKQRFITRDRLREAEKEIMILDSCEEFLTTMFSDENPNACCVM